MPCFKPLQAWMLECGTVVFAERGKILRELTLPCGQCVGCRLERSRQWAIRCVHEASMHEYNSFVTLTYNDENVPHDFSLKYRDFQLFMKRLRKQMPGVRFYMCGEYGEDFGRPHFHACLFGAFFPDRRLYSEREGIRLYTSASLDKLWPSGFASVGDVTFESAAYIARYVMKKITGSRAESHYERVDGYTGEIYAIEPEFNRMSLKPGIGAKWLEKYEKDVYPHDYVIVRGVKMKPPRYYDKRLKALESLVSDVVAAGREKKAAAMSDECTVERLAVREKVAKARVSQLKRTLK